MMSCPASVANKDWSASSPRLDNPRASYRAETPTNPKIGQKIPARHTNWNSPLRQGIEKIPRKYQKNTPKIRISYFLSIPGGIWRGISGSLMFCMLGGIFALRWLSYSVAGRGVVNPRPPSTASGWSSSRYWRKQDSHLAAGKTDMSNFSP